MSAAQIAATVKWVNFAFMALNLAIGFFCLTLSHYSKSFLMLMWISYGMALVCFFTARRFSRIQDVLENAHD